MHASDEENDGTREQQVALHPHVYVGMNVDACMEEEDGQPLLSEPKTNRDMVGWFRQRRFVGGIFGVTCLFLVGWSVRQPAQFTDVQEMIQQRQVRVRNLPESQKLELVRDFEGSYTMSDNFRNGERKQKLFTLGDTRGFYFPSPGYHKAWRSTIQKSSSFQKTANSIAVQVMASIKGMGGLWTASATASTKRVSASNYKQFRADYEYYFEHSKILLELLPNQLVNKLTPEAKQYLETKSPQQICDSFGFFYATSIIMGAKAVMEMTQEATSRSTSTTFDAEVSYKKKMFAEVTGRTRISTAQKSGENDMKSEVTAIGGNWRAFMTSDSFNKQLENWAAYFDDHDPVIIGYRFEPIWTLVKEIDRVKGTNLERFVKETYPEISMNLAIKPDAFNDVKIGNGGCSNWNHVYDWNALCKHCDYDTCREKCIEHPTCKYYSHGGGMHNECYRLWGECNLEASSHWQGHHRLVGGWVQTRFELHTKSWAREINVYLTKGYDENKLNKKGDDYNDVLFLARELKDRQSFSKTLTKKTGPYTLTLEDTYGDGWHGGYLILNGMKYTVTEKQGKKKIAHIKL